MKKDSVIKGLKVSGAFSLALLLLIFILAAFNDRIRFDDIAAEVKKQKDIQRSAVLLNNQNQLIPLKDLSSFQIASINLGHANSSAFQAMASNYTNVTEVPFNSSLSIADLNSFNTIIFQVNAQMLFSASVMSLIQETSRSKNIIIAGFGTTAGLKKLESITAPVIWNPEESVSASAISAQLIFGGEAASGKLQDSISLKYPKGAGFFTQKTRLKYSTPEEVGISSTRLSKIDNIVAEAINQRATPGAVVMVVKDGNVIFNKSYGSHTYENIVPTKVTDIFDIASVTKTAATTIAAMKLFEEHKLDLNSGIGEYLEDARSTNKSNIPIRDVMLHQAGFVNLDFFGGLKPQDHSRDSSVFFPVKAADNYYLRRDYYKEVMWPKMLRTPLPTRGQYVYSDISMYVMKEIIEHQSQKSLDRYVADEFYRSLGMHTAGFNPRRRFAKDRIVPTERDTYFRKSLLEGYVHDSGAAMAGGVSGHAGLFATANDLAILNQMLLNGGSYGGIQYLQPETIHLFTARQSDVSRRGLGFDKGTGKGYPSTYASSDTFGHTGYTGTCVWVDPKENLVYIFLSNRVHPSASNKLNSLRIRPRIQDAIYEAISDGNHRIANAG